MRLFEGTIPSGLLDTALLQRSLYRTLRREGFGDRFATLPSDLHIIATDLDSGERTVFNRANPAPISKTVAASCALPRSVGARCRRLDDRLRSDPRGPQHPEPDSCHACEPTVHRGERTRGTQQSGPRSTWRCSAATASPS